MDRTKLIILAGLGAILAAGLYGSLHHDDQPLTEKDRIKLLLEKAEELAKQRDRNGLLDLVADDYEDPQGWHKKDVSRMLAFWFLRTRSIGVYLVDPEVQVNGNNAMVNVRAVLTRGRGPIGDIIPTDASVYDFRVELEKQDDEWKIVSHRRRRVR